RIYWVLCDGGEPNRSFVKLLDSKHNFKKIRNHLEKSTLQSNNTRQLTVNNLRILFKFWKDAYEWDQGSHPLSLHERLTDGHV
ncbi:unnamed protein product, partial [Porites evermanni]